jgi:hypothetical protein
MLDRTEGSAGLPPDTTTTPCTAQSPKQLRIDFMYQPTSALNEICFVTSINLLHVSAPGCHLQGIFRIKGIQSQHANLGTAAHYLE